MIPIPEKETMDLNTKVKVTTEIDKPDDVPDEVWDNIKPEGKRPFVDYIDSLPTPVRRATAIWTHGSNAYKKENPRK